MNNKITYRNSEALSSEKKMDTATGSAFWSIEGKSVQFTWFNVAADTAFPNHKHDSEQITYVLEGELFFRSNDIVYKLSKGDCILVPANIDHEVWTEAVPATAVDAWSPVNNTYSSHIITK